MPCTHNKYIVQYATGVPRYAIHRHERTEMRARRQSLKRRRRKLVSRPCMISCAVPQCKRRTPIPGFLGISRHVFGAFWLHRIFFNTLQLDMVRALAESGSGCASLEVRLQQLVVLSRFGRPRFFLHEGLQVEIVGVPRVQQWSESVDIRNAPHEI